jgi:hypothetical protein
LSVEEVAVKRVCIDYWLWERISVRTLSLPTGLYVGSLWSNGDTKAPRLSIILPGDKEGTVNIVSAPVTWSDAHRWLFPRGWREAIRAYDERWKFPKPGNVHRLILTGKPAFRRGVR